MGFDPARHPNGVKKRRHHNNKGKQRIRGGGVYNDVRKLARRLGIPYLTREQAEKQREETDLNRI